MTCRFPGCNEPADVCDLDHTIAYPIGPTCASNLKCLCRKHHLLKTFWGGPRGWRDEQLPDGTLIWTSPTGQTYTTHPGSRPFFPALSRPTAPVNLPAAGVAAASEQPVRGLAMPKRRRTRAQDRNQRINTERQLNETGAAQPRCVNPHASRGPQKSGGARRDRGGRPSFVSILFGRCCNTPT